MANNLQPQGAGMNMADNEVSNTGVLEDDKFLKDNDDLFVVEKKPEGAAQLAAKPEGGTTPSTPAAEPKASGKFTGKSLDDVIEMYGNLEKAYGHQGNEMGQMRQVADQILQNQIAAKATPSQEPVKVDADAVLENPTEAVNSLVATNPVIQDLTGRLAARERADSLRDLETKHGSIQSYGSNQEFLTWVAANPMRVQRYTHANDNHDFATADDLISTWKEVKAATGEAHSEQRTEQMAAVASVDAGSGSSAATLNQKGTGKIFARTKLMELKINDPERYHKLQPQIMKAYAEGRVR